MAGKSVLYNIKSKDQTKAGVTSAVKGLEKFNKKVGNVQNTLKNAFIGGAVVTGLIMLKNRVDDLTDAFAVQEKAEKLLTAAAANNPMINGSAVKGLKNYASQLQKNSVYGDESIIQYETWLVTQGKTEEQIKKIMQASVDLASSGLMPLESAVKNVAKTYAGMSGELGESIPALRELTAEQMKNGAAVDLISEKYAGMAKAFAESAEGQKIQLENIKGDIKENIGAIFKGISGDFNTKLIPIMNKVNDWIAANKDRIINFFKNFPGIAKASFKLAADFLKNIFSLDFLKTLGSFMWEVFKAQGKNSIEIIFNVLKAVGSTFWEPLKYGFEMIIYGIKELFSNVINFFIGKLNSLAAGAHNVTQKILHPLNAANRSDFTGGIDPLDNNAAAPENNVKDNITGAWKEATENTKNSLNETIEGFKSAFGEFKESSPELENVFNNYMNDVNALLDKPVKVEADQTAATAAAAAAADGTTPKAEEEAGGVLSGILSGVGGQFLGMLTSLSSVQAILDPIGIMLNSLMETLAPMIDKLLQPLIGILAIIGELAGQILIPIIELLIPVVQALAIVFIWIYNKVLRPIGNGLIGIFQTVNNAIARFINAILDFATALTGNEYTHLKTKAVNWDTLKEINTSSLNSAGASYSGDYVGGSSGGTAANYSGVRDVIVNVVYNVGISAYDDRDIALKIRNEIKAAEALGY